MNPNEALTYTAEQQSHLDKVRQYLVEGLITEEEFLNENAAIEQQAIIARNQRQLEKLNSLLTKGIITRKDYDVYVARLEPQIQEVQYSEQDQAAYQEMHHQIEAYSQERVQLYESIQQHQMENEHLKEENAGLVSKVKTLEDQLSKLKGTSLFGQLQDSLRKLERTSHDRSMRQKETDELIEKSTKANEKFITAKESLQERVNRLLDNQQNAIEADVVQARDDTAVMLKQSTQDALARIDEEVKDPDQNDWVKLYEQSQKLLEQETKTRDRITQLQEQKKALQGNIDPALTTMETLREELEKIIKELKQSRLESGRRSREARMLDMTIEELEDNDAPAALIQAKRDEIENSKAMQRRADERAFQLRVQLVEKSRMENSLPEYQLLAQLTTTKSTADKSVSPSASMVIRDYVVEKEMSVGAQARVFLCKSTKTQQQVVVKAYIIRDALSNFDEGIKECRVVQSINHPNVVKIIEFFHMQHDKLGACFCIVMPYYSDGDLESMISRARRDTKYLPRGVVLRMASQLANGLKAIHAAKLIHRDLKPQNIFVNPETNSFIIGDFGLVKTSNTKVTKTSKAGTEDYMSPEMKSSKQRYTEKSDIWSLGCIMYDVMSLKHCNMVHETLEAIVEGTLDELLAELQSEMRRSNQYPESIIQLVMKMLNRSPTDRPSADNIVNMRELFDNDQHDDGASILSTTTSTQDKPQPSAPLKRRASMLLRQNSSTSTMASYAQQHQQQQQQQQVSSIPPSIKSSPRSNSDAIKTSPRSDHVLNNTSNLKEALQSNKLVRGRSEAVKARQSAPIVQPVSPYQEKPKPEPKPISNNIRDKFESVTKREDDANNKRNTITFGASKPVSDVKARWEQKAVEQSKTSTQVEPTPNKPSRVLSSVLNKFKPSTTANASTNLDEKTSPGRQVSPGRDDKVQSSVTVTPTPAPAPAIKPTPAIKSTPVVAAAHARQDSITQVESEGEDDDSSTEEEDDEEEEEEEEETKAPPPSSIPMLVIDAPPPSNNNQTSTSTNQQQEQQLDDDLDEYINMFEDNKPSLTKIDFSNVKTPFKHIHSDQIQDLAECWGENETVLSVSMKGKGVDNIVLSYLCPQIAYNLTMEHWDLSDNQDINDMALKQLEAFVGKNKAVEKLVLSNTCLSEKSMNTLLSSAKKNNSKLVIVF